MDGRLVESFYDHPKVLAAGLTATGLYASALSYCGRQETAGFVPAPVAALLSRYDPALCTLLVDVGLWEPCDGGYAVHDYAQHNPATAAGRALSLFSPGSSLSSPGSSKHRIANIISETEQSGNIPKGRAGRLPAEFGLTPAMREYALGKGVANPEGEFEAFTDHHRAKGSTMVDWPAAWRTWCRRAVEYAARGIRAPGRWTNSKTAGNVEALQEFVRRVKTNGRNGGKTE